MANFLVEFKRNKFRISIPSRRQPKLSHSKGMPLLANIPFVETKWQNRYSQHPKSNVYDNKHNNNANSFKELQEKYEYVYLNEDLINQLRAQINMLIAPVKVEGPEELTHLTSFRCMVSWFSEG